MVWAIRLVHCKLLLSKKETRFAPHAAYASIPICNIYGQVAIVYMPYPISFLLYNLWVHTYTPSLLHYVYTYSQVPLKLPLQLKWRRGPDMPFGMTYIQSVQVQGTLYAGGGLADDDDNSYIVMTYDINAGKWATLPPYNTCHFAMTAIDDHLVLVGGKGHDGVRSKVLDVWSEDGNKWTHPYPDMTIPRSHCSAVVDKQYLVVAGAGGRLSSVEVMNTDTKQWYAGPPTPIVWTSMKTAVVSNTCYFMGGNTNKVYSVSLPALVSQLNSDSSAKNAQIWKKLPQLPDKGAAPLSISGSLLAVGGADKGDSSTALHLYQPDAGQWVKVADMPAPHFTPTCIMITNNELLVAGGYCKGRLETMHIAQNLC